MALTGGLDALITDADADADALARRLQPFALPRLEVRRRAGFIALIPAEPEPRRQELADLCVTIFDHHRAPEPPARIADRAQGIDARGAAHLARWGYPYVLDRWQFHMTLSEHLPPTDPLDEVAAEFFAPALKLHHEVRSLALFIEPQPGAPFRLIKRLRFGGAS